MSRLPNPNGYITLREQRNALGNVEQYDYAWHGGAIVAIEGHRLMSSLGMDARLTGLLPEKAPFVGLFRVGPFRLRAVGYDISHCATIAVRADSWRGWITSVVWPARQWFDLAYRRLILTAAVWGLAERHQNAIPSWRDVHALKRWAR